MTSLRGAVSTALVLASGLATACGGSVSSSNAAGGSAGSAGNAGSGGQGATGGYSASGGQAGTAGTAGAAGTGGSAGMGGAGGRTVIAVNELFFGDTDPNGTLDPNAWRDIGENLDGLDSTPQDTNHCMPVAGANPADVKTDGVGGIDNSFGENLLPLFTALAADFSTTVNQSIADGSFTELFRLDGLLDPAQAPNQNAIAASLYGGAPKGSPALFNGTDVWPVTNVSVVNNDINAPKVTFPASYVKSGSWVSGNKAAFTLPVDVQGYELDLPITNARFRMRIAGVGTSASATAGTIAGIIKTTALVDQYKQVAGSFDPSLCSGPTFDSIAHQVSAASDIMSDGTNGDPTRTCNAISIGIGFNGAAVRLGPVAPPVPAPPDPCAP